MFGPVTGVHRVLVDSHLLLSPLGNQEFGLRGRTLTKSYVGLTVIKQNVEMDRKKTNIRINK